MSSSSAILSTMTFTPRTRAVLPEGKISVDSLKNSTILVIDDDSDTCELLRMLLEDYGAAVIVANSVDGALAICRRTPPHLVLSDIQLGSSDGFALIEALRKHNREVQKFIPAVALSGFVAASTKERAMASGFDAFIQKPFDSADLISTISWLLRKRAMFFTA